MRKVFFLLALSFLFSCKNDAPQQYDNWEAYLGGKDANQYSPLDQINTGNVHQLKQAWIYQSGDRDTANRSQIQCNPLIIDGVFYGTSPKLKLFALDASNGEERWVFDPFEGNYKDFGMGVNRGLAFWKRENENRIFYTAGPFLFAINPKNGQPIRSFGEDGKVDLHQGLDREVEGLFIVSNTPGIIFEDLLILGSRVSESTGPVPGHVRAFDVKTGEIRWIFHTIPHPGEVGYNTWPEDAWKNSGGANAWSGFSLDEERGIVFVPTGSASFDFYGGDRHGENLFANCVLALNAQTGERIWHYQTIHHDLWDRDLPAPGNLLTVTHNGQQIDAIAQITKAGYVFLFNRETGEPLFQIEERPVPPSDLEGESAWPTQPFPVKPPPFSRQEVTAKDLDTRSPEVYEYAKSVWERARKGSPYIPPNEEGFLLFPGFDGGGEWGGAAADPNSGIMYINSSEMPWLMQMGKYELPDDGLLASKGRQLYNVACIACHGSQLEGSNMYGNTPALTGLKDRLTADEVKSVIKNGKGVMPSFAVLKPQEVDALTAFLFDSSEKIAADSLDTNVNPTWPYPYVFKGYNRFYGPDGYPAITPPWGQLSAIDLNEGSIKWQITLGEHPELTAQGIPPTGTENYGGPAITAGGLIFIAATMDEKIRAFDQKDGRLLWESDLPAAGYATPAIYAIDGKQYIVIAAGGGKLGTKSGDAYVAFSL